MPNTNCLKGMACPACGYDKRFYINASIIADVTDDGADIAPNPACAVEWDNESGIECKSCGHSGTVKEFTTA